jgi:hypothetical protein
MNAEQAGCLVRTGAGTPMGNLCGSAVLVSHFGRRLRYDDDSVLATYFRARQSNSK